MFLNFFKNKLAAAPDVSLDDIPRLEATALAGIILADYEEFRPVAYHATEDERRRGIYTVGFGRTVGVKAGDRISYSDACHDLKDRINSLISQLKGWNSALFTQFTPGQVAALVSLLYNVGEGNFTGGATFKSFLAGDVRGIIEHGFDKEKGFVKQSGKILRGLVDRREKESTLLLADLK